MLTVVLTKLFYCCSYFTFFFAPPPLSLKQQQGKQNTNPKITSTKILNMPINMQNNTDWKQTTEGNKMSMISVVVGFFF